MKQVTRHDFIMHQGVTEYIILEYNKNISENDLFAVVRRRGVDEEYVAKFQIQKIPNTLDTSDEVYTFELSLDGTLLPGRYCYDVFVYEDNVPKDKILWGYILVKESVSNRGRSDGV